MGLRVRVILFTILTTFTSYAYSDANDLDKARDALSKQSDDADTEKALEEVFESAEKSYSLLPKGKMSVNYNTDYSYYGDQRIDFEIRDSVVQTLDVTPVASHTFTNSFSVDYGVFNNLTANVRVPFVAKFETQQELKGYGIGDLSSTLRWQPFEYVPGKVSQTYFFSMTLPTGVSAYEIDEDEALSTGSGTWSFSSGVSASKVLDPVVVFGSLSAGYSLAQTGLEQIKNNAILTEVNPGPSLSVSMGFAYSLSYDVSLSASFQGSYSHKSRFTLIERGGRELTSEVASQMSGIMNFALGVRVSPKTIANVNVGFGMTELSPDIILGLSLPIDIEGFGF